MSIRARVCSKLFVAAIGLSLLTTGLGIVSDNRSSVQIDEYLAAGQDDEPPRDCRPEECGVGGLQGPRPGPRPRPRPRVAAASVG